LLELNEVFLLLEDILAVGLVVLLFAGLGGKYLGKACGGKVLGGTVK